MPRGIFGFQPTRIQIQIAPLERGGRALSTNAHCVGVSFGITGFDIMTQIGGKQQCKIGPRISTNRTEPIRALERTGRTLRYNGPFLTRLPPFESAEKGLSNGGNLVKNGPLHRKVRPVLSKALIGSVQFVETSGPILQLFSVEMSDPV